MTAKQILEKQKTLKEQKISRKRDKKFQKQLRKKEDARMVIQRREKWEANIKQKKHEKAETTAQRLANKQLKDELKLATSNQKKTSRAKKQVTIMVSDLDSEDEIVIAERLTPRSRRTTKVPGRFKQFELY